MRHLHIHFLSGKLSSGQRPAIEVSQDSFQNHNRAVHHDTEVDGPQTHQVGRHPEDTHHDKTEQHGQRNHRSHNQSRPYIAQEDNQHQKHNQSPLNQVAHHRRNIPVHQFRTVQVRFHADPFGQHFLHGSYPLLQFTGHHIRVGPFQHHCDTSHTFSFTVLGHGTEALRRTKLHLTDIAHMHRNTTAVGYHHLLDVADILNHTLRADVISLFRFLNVTATRILVVPVQCREYLPNRNVQREQGVRIDRHLILLQITSETVDFHNSRNTRQLPSYNPVLDGTQLHGIIPVLITGSHLQHILINLSQSGGNRHQLGRTQFGRNLHRLNLLIDQLPGVEHRNIFLKHYRHQRESETGYRPDFFHIHDITHTHLDGESNELFHFLRSQCRRYGHNLHLIVRNIRHCINGQCQHGVDASCQQQQGSQHHKHLFPDRKVNDFLKHIFCSDYLNNYTILMVQR